MQRTEMYRRRLTTAAPKEGLDLDSFLKSLGMQLRIREPSIHQRTRAHQLINKTNQFNLNGVRIDEVDMADMLAAGGRLFVADLTDRSGSHGEIIAFLVDVSGIVRSFVMSCRVFQRRVEYSFLCWLARNWSGPQLVFDYRTSERNAPARMFFDESAFSANADGLLSFDAKVFLGAHEQAAALVSIETDAEVQVA